MAEKKEQGLIIGEEKVNGFRDGMNKKKLLQSLTKEDWVRIDKMKEAEERKVTSERAYKLYVDSDQMKIQFKENVEAIDRCCVEILDLNQRINHNLVDIKKGESTQKTEDGHTMTADDLKIRNLLYEGMINRQIRMLKTYCSGLYVYTNKMGLDRKPFFSEEDYEKKIEDVMGKLSQTKYKLFE